jgi:hypothetical protein
MALSEEEIQNINVFKLNDDNDIYNIVRNYDINKLFNKLVIPNATKEQLKDNLKKALTEKKTDEALKILNYILKYKHNYYKRNDVLLDDETPSINTKEITLKDAGFYEVIFEGASAKSKWYSDITSNFEHFLVYSSPWLDNLSLKFEESQKCLFLLKNFNYFLSNKTEDNTYELYLGNYELNDKGCFLFKKYKTVLNFDQLKNLYENTILSLNDNTYENIEIKLSSLLENHSKEGDEYIFEKLDNTLLDYFEYNSSAYAAYGSRQIFIENYKTLLYTDKNINHHVYLKGSKVGDAELESALDNIIYDTVKDWVNSDDATYETKDYYDDFCQTKNLMPTGESSYLSKIVSLNSNSTIKYLLQSFESDLNSSITIENENTIIPKPDSSTSNIENSDFDRNTELSQNDDHKYVGHKFGLDYDEHHLNSELNGFIGGGRKGYGQHMNHQDVCYWCNGDDAHIKIRYLGDKDAILKRVFFQNDSFDNSGKRISLKGKQSSISNFDYIDIPSGSVIEFKYKCSSVLKSLNFDKCFVTVLRNNTSIYDKEYSTYGFENELDSKTVLTDNLLTSLNKTENIFFDVISEDQIELSTIYQALNTKTQRWTMSELFFNNSNLLKESKDFVNFNIDKDWNYYTISFRVFDNMILDFGNISDEVDTYNNVILDGLDSKCNELMSKKEYFNKSNIHESNDFISQFTLEGEEQNRITDDNLNSLYNKNYHDTVSFDSDESSALKTIIHVKDTEREKETRLDNYHDYRIFCERFEKIYITIKSGNQVGLKSINMNIPFGDYELPLNANEEYYGYINNFYFKRTAVSEEQLYSKRISVKQGEYIYFKCEYNSCRVEVDKELSSFPEDTFVYPVNFDPFENKFYSLSPADYPEGTEGYKGYEKGTDGRTFQWLRFTTSNASYDIVIFIKKLTVEIGFLNDLFGQDLITKNYDNNQFEPNESFSFYVKLPHNCRISTYKYSDNMTYSYAESDKTSYGEYFNENCYESFISFYKGNSEKIISNFKDYIYSLSDPIGSHSSVRELYEIFNSTFTSIDKKINYFSDDSVLFIFQAKYADSHIRISEDYIVGSQIVENFTGNHNDRLLTAGLYRVVATSGNTGRGGNGGNVNPSRIYAGVISGSGGGGLYGGNSGNACQNQVISPYDAVHPMFQVTFKFKLVFRLGLKFGRWEIGKEITIFDPPPLSKNFGINSDKDGNGTVGLQIFMGVGSGAGGSGFYKEGITAGDGTWFLGGLTDILVDKSAVPLKDSSFTNDTDWTINNVFKNHLKNGDYTNQKKYFIECFGAEKSSSVSKNGQLLGTNYLTNDFNERYRGVFFDAILNISANENKNNKILISSKIGSSGREGLNGSDSTMDENGQLMSLPKNGICGQEGKPTVFELDQNSSFKVVYGSYFTNLKKELFGLKSLSKCLLCGGVHDTAPQKSFDITNNWQTTESSPSDINSYLRDYVESNSNISVAYYGTSSSDKDKWKTMDVHTFPWGKSSYTQTHLVPNRKNTFGSFIYVGFAWFWIQIELKFLLSTDFTNISADNMPIQFIVDKGFKYMDGSNFPEENVSVKYQPKLLPLVWDTKSHVIYSISNCDSKLSKDDVNDNNFSHYSPTDYLDIDNNSHFQAPYPFNWPNTPFISENTLNNLFGSSSAGSKYNENIKTYLYNYIECYENFKNKSVWLDDYNVYKSNTLCVSNIGLTKKVLDGKPVDGRLISYETNADTTFKSDVTDVESHIEKNKTLSTSKIDIQENMFYKCSFLLGNDNQFEIPIDGYDHDIVSTLNTILGHGDKIKIYTETFEQLLDEKAASITYSSEAFSEQSYNSNTLKFNYLKLTSNVIFKNNESLIGIFKIGKVSNNNYTITKIGSFNSKKFILEIMDKDANGLIIYNSLETNNTVTLDFRRNYLIMTTYDNIIVKHGDDYYVILYDVNNSLFGTISENNLVNNSAQPFKELNYFLEYPSSRGRVPLINDSLLEIVYLGRDISTLNIEDKQKHGIAYVYGGMLYKNENTTELKETTVKYADLQLIDEDTDYTMLIDYKHLCDGKAILNSSQSEWLKI